MLKRVRLGMLVGLVVFAAVLALIAGTRPSGAGWVAVSPAGEHVTALAYDPVGDSGLAGTQAGSFLISEAGGRWRLADSATIAALPEPAPITAIHVGEAPLVGTASGLYSASAPGQWQAVGGGLPAGVRVSNLVALPAGELLLAASPAQMYRSRNGGLRWSALPEEGLPASASVYRAVGGRGARTGLLYAGTIGGGVYVLDTEAEHPVWARENLGLPQAVNVFALQQLPDDVLVAGTDQGIFRQARRGGRWEPLGSVLQRARVLALAVSGDETGQWLWAGTDSAVYRVRLAPSGGAPLQGQWQEVHAHEPLQRSVSWIVATPHGMQISAGRVYRLQTLPPVTLRSVLLALLGGLAAFGLVQVYARAR
jgi:ligand-binding sensor domain-containing protein